MRARQRKVDEDAMYLSGAYEACAKLGEVKVEAGNRKLSSGS